MSLLRIVCALVVASISTGVLGGKSMCASFQTDSKTASLSNGSYLATLTFSVHNTCAGESSQLKSIKVFRNLEQGLKTQTCDAVFFNKGFFNCSLLTTCTCDSSSTKRFRLSVTRRIDNVQGETWLLVGALANGDNFSETVEIRQGRMPAPEENTSLVVGLAASAGILVVILCLALVAVCYLQKRRSGAWPLSLNFPISRRPAHRDPNATLPRQPTSPAVEHGDQQNGERQSPSGESQCMFYSDNYEVVKDSLVSL